MLKPHPLINMSIVMRFYIPITMEENYVTPMTMEEN